VKAKRSGDTQTLFCVGDPFLGSVQHELQTKAIPYLYLGRADNNL